MTFDAAAKSVKALWVPIVAGAKDRYHWRTVRLSDGVGGEKEEIWGLVALHIITRDLPNWFWADFAHKDFLEGCKNARGCLPRDSTTRDSDAPSGRARSGKDGERNETVGSKWSNYRLRGTQVDYVDSVGRETVLSNPMLEANEPSSSCITCHARAAIAPNSLTLGERGATIASITGSGTGAHRPKSDFSDIGPPDTSIFLAGTATLQYLQTDFLFSIPFRAFSEKK